MKLFDEMEKCFPETEKQWDEIIEAQDGWLLTPMLVQAAETVLCDWVIEHYLLQDSKLHALFVQAGITSERQMAALIVEWMHRARRFEGRPYISRKDTSLALQLGHQSARLVL